MNKRVNISNPFKNRISDHYPEELRKVISEFIMQANELLSPKVIMALVRNTGIGKMPLKDGDASPEYVYKLSLAMAELLLSEEFHDFQRLIAAKFIDLAAKALGEPPMLEPEEVGGIDRTIEQVVSGNIEKLIIWKSLSTGERRAFYYIARGLPPELLKTDILPIPVGIRTEDLETLLKYVNGGMPVYVAKRIYQSLKSGDRSFNAAYYRAAYSFLSQQVYNSSRGEPTEVMKEKLRKMHSVEPPLPQESQRDYIERCCLQQQGSAKKPKKQAGCLSRAARLSAKNLRLTTSQTSSLTELELPQD